MHWGVMGVATATVISRIVNLIIVATMGAVLIKAKNSPERIAPGKILGQIIKIGFPSACETALYNIAMTLVVRFMNQMDADGINVTARSYASQIANFSHNVVTQKRKCDRKAGCRNHTIDSGLASALIAFVILLCTDMPAGQNGICLS